jgi:hypothetical protein
MPDPIDLDELDRLYAKATAGPYHKKRAGICGTAGQVYSVRPPQFTMYGSMSEADADCWIGLHNSYPALAAELRQLRETVAKQPRTRDGVAVVDGMPLYPDHGGILETHAQRLQEACDEMHRLLDLKKQLEEQKQQLQNLLRGAEAIEAEIKAVKDQSNAK